MDCPACEAEIDPDDEIFSDFGCCPFCDHEIFSDQFAASIEADPDDHPAH